MDIIISHKAALEAIRQPSTWNRLGRPAVPVVAAPAKMPGADVLGRIETLGICAKKPVSVLVSSKSATHLSSRVVPHVWSRDLPPGAVFEVAPGIGCASPLFLPFLFAPKLEKEDLSFLLSELMGLYAFAPSGDLLQRPRPLIDETGIKTFASSLHGARGSAGVRTALQDVVAMAASPMEVCLCLRATRSFAQGGYRMGEVLLNGDVAVSRFEGSGRRGQIRRPDLMFEGPGGKACLDYMGAHHAGTIQRDARRRNELLSAGITPHEIFKEEYDDLSYMDSLMASIRRDIGLPSHDARGLRGEKERSARRALWEDLERRRARGWESRPEAW